MAANRLYQKDLYQKTASGKILSVARKEGAQALCLDQTLFFPEGGGQSCDTGLVTSGEYRGRVTAVYEEGKEVVHRLEPLPGDPPEKLQGLREGMTVDMVIDWDRRFDNMQRHCGEHILSGAFYRLFRGHNKGFHMGEDYITVDIAFDEGAPRSKVTWEMAMEAEAEANRVIMADLPVRTDHFSEREEAAGCPLRKPLAFDEDISVVTIGDPGDPVDCVACCGTHPARTGEIGLLKIYKIEPNKGMSRIYFEAGNRALSHYREQFDSLYEISKALSAGTGEALEKFRAYQQRTEKNREELAALRGRMLEVEAAALEGRMAPGLVARYEDYSVDDLFHLGKKLTGKLQGAVALVCVPANTVVLLSEGTPSCGELVKAHAPGLGGKGGGRPDSARAVFPDPESLEKFLEIALK